jgi:hypothetical protein
MPILVKGMSLASLAGVSAIVCPHSASRNPAKAKILQQLAGVGIGLRIEEHPYPPADKLCIQLVVLAELTDFDDVLLVLVHGLVLSFEVRELSVLLPSTFRLYTSTHRLASAIYHIPGIL